MRRMLIVGAGRIGGLNERDPVRRKPCTHAGMAQARADLELVGIVDVEIARARDFADLFGLDAAFDDVDQALATLRPDIVTVAVPYQRQAEIVLRIAESDHKPSRLLLEKPLAETLEQAEAIIDACEAAGIEVLVNNECAAAVYRQIRDILRDRFGNEVISVSAWCSSGMNAIGIHLIGVLRYLFGDLVHACARAETEYVASLPFSTNFVPDDPRLHAMLTFENGISGFLINSALTRYTYKEFEVTCRGGKLRLSDNTNLLQVWTTAKPGASTLSYRLDEPETVPVEPGTVFDAIGGFLAGETGAGQDVIGGREGLANYRVLDGLVRSAHEDRRVAFLPASGQQACVEP